MLSVWRVFREKPIGSVIYMKSKLDHGLGNIWNSRSLIQWVIIVLTG